MSGHAPVHYEGAHCTLSIESPASGIVVLSISGHDVGEFGPAPMSRLATYLSGDRPVEFYIDARHTKGASIDVSGDWALWLGAHRSHFKHIRMLPGSRFIEITAGFVRRFSSLEDVMRVDTDGDAFDEALAASVAAAERRDKT